jgi:hypothetical protein
LPRAEKKHSAKKFFAESQNSLPSVFCFALGKEASLSRVFSLLGVFYFALGKAFFTESFLFGSRQRTAL